MPDPRFKKKPLYGCSGCSQDFTSLALFDSHRAVGVYTYTYSEGAQGFWPPREDGRRCLGSDEMEAKGWARDATGRWLNPLRVQAARRSFAKAALELA